MSISQFLRPLALFITFAPSLLPQCCVAETASLGKVSDEYFTPLVNSGSIRAAVCVIIEGDGSATVRLYGPVTEDSLWRVASVSKVFTAIAIMQLVERGQVQLDGDVNRYLKHIHLAEPYSQPITIREILTHRSGLDDRFIGDGFHAGPQPRIAEVMERNTPASVYPPNTVEFYSNYGYGILGAVIEDVTGQKFEDYIQSNVLRPIGMLDSTFAQPLSQPSRMAPGTWFYQRASPAAALSTSAKDMRKFLQSILLENSSVLSPRSFDEMTVRPGAAVRLQHELGYWSGNDRGRHLIGASGDSGSFHSVLMTFPDERLGYFTLVSGGGNAVAWDFYERFAKAEFGPATIAPIPIGTTQQMTSRELSHFAGLYRTVRYPHHDLSKTFILLDLTRVSLSKNGGLSIHGTRWLPTGPCTFRKEGGTDLMTFQTDDAGRIRFLNDSQEKISWYETGYAAIAFYFSFLVAFTIGIIRSKRFMRGISAVVLLHSLGWLAMCLAVGPSNLIFGFPFILKCILSIGTLLPLFAAAALLAAWRRRARLDYTLAAAVLAYIPFVWSWNLKL